MARFSIGIDLGTTNSVLAYVEHGAAGRSPRVLAIPQWDSARTTAALEQLPSFAYRVPAGERSGAFVAGPETAPAPERDWVTGVLARERMATSPGRVVHSAKSWLCHAGVDRTSPILPWKSDEVPAAERVSPVQASAAYLAHFRAAWERSLGAAGPEAAFADQDVVITVPASFDEAAQQLTLEAAHEAGFPATVRLLEEPQAAFYQWLGERRNWSVLSDLLDARATGTLRVLVCDVGGGTTDLSLFEVFPDPDAAPGLGFRRQAVSDHILLGGDNIDLTLAYRLEAKLGHGGDKLAGRQWSQLIAQARELKERVLGDELLQDEFSVTLAGSGSGLVASTLSARIAAAEVRDLVLEGFFPDCPADARTRRSGGGLREWGLPFAADSAVTRHLAEFLGGQRVDAVLFNGGTLIPAFLRQRLVDLLGRWQDGAPPTALVNSEMALAVARGATRYGAILRAPESGVRIAGGHAHALYLEVHGGRGRRRAPLVCVLPKGMEARETARVEKSEFDLLVNRPVRFQCYYSNRRTTDRPGDVVDWNESEFAALPPLQTAIHLPPERPKPPNNRIRVILESSLNELGLFQVHCVEAHGAGRWRLDFNLRAAAGDEPEQEPAAEPLASPAKLAQAEALVRALYGKKRTPDLPEVKPRQLMKRLESTLASSRDSWDSGTLRALWPSLAAGMTRKSRSVDHEAAWLYLAGFALRPGYGVELDESRMEELWRLFSLGLSFPKEKRAQAQWFLLWRRTAGGLHAARQLKVVDKVLGPVRSGGGTDEMVHLAGALERLPPELKLELAGIFADRLASPKGRHKAPFAWALGRILSRTPLYGGRETILLPGEVVKLFERLRQLDWTQPEYGHLNGVFAQIARRTDQRDIDLPRETRAAVAAKMEESGASAEQLAVVREFVPIADADRVRQFGESLPTGLVLVAS